MAKDIEFIENFIENHIKASIKADITPLLKERNEDGEIGGYFAVPLLVFTLTEYLGSLYSGEYRKEGNSISAVNFIRCYFGKVNKRYEHIGGLLYDMFRHGTVHERQPKQYMFKDKNGFGWELIKNERYSEHLTVDKGLYLVLVLDVLSEDLLKAVDFFLKDLRTHVGLRASFISAYNEMKRPKEVDVIKKEKNKLIKNDFEIIRKDIKKIF